MASPTTLKLDVIDILYRVEKNEDKLNKFSEILRTDSAKNSFGRRVIQKIKENTANNKDKNGDPFYPSTYSKGYRKSLKFRIYGKDKDDVNMKLTGKMLASMDIMDTDSTSVTIGFNQPAQEAKAEGHILGTGNNNSLPIRDFFGLQDEEYNKIMKKIIKDEGETLVKDFVIESAISGILELRAGLNAAEIAELTALGGLLDDV